MGDYCNTLDEAVKEFEIPVQCGECYVWYDNHKDEICPICFSDEIVGDR